MAQARHAHPQPHSTAQWNNYDTAVYVESKINLLSARLPGQLSDALAQGAGVTRFEVLADIRRHSLYFIRLDRSDGTTVGVLVYQMGWRVPREVTGAPPILHAVQASAPYLRAYVTDTLTAIGTFNDLVGATGD